MRHRILSCLLWLAATIVLPWSASAALPNLTVTSPRSNLYQIDRQVNFVVSTKSGVYDKVQIKVRQGGPRVQPLATLTASCSADSARSGYDRCTASYVQQPNTFGIRYYFTPTGWSGDESFDGTGYIYLLWPQPKPQPKILSIRSLDSYVPITEYALLDNNQTVFADALIAEDASGLLNPSVLQILNSSNKVVAQQDITFSNQGGKILAKTDLKMTDKNNKPLSAGTYYAKVVSYLTAADKASGKNGYGSPTSKINYVSPRVNLRMAAPGVIGTGYLPACLLRLRAQQQKTAFIFPSAFSRWSLEALNNFGNVKSGQSFEMTALADGQSAEYLLNLNGLSDGTLINVRAKAYYRAAGKDEGAFAATDKAAWRIRDEAGDRAACGQANQLYWLAYPQFNDLCAAGSPTITAGPGGEKFFWRSGDQAWSWRCDGLCVDRSPATVDCASLTPEIILSKTPAAGGNWDLRVDSNFDLKLIASMQLWQVPVGGHQRSLGAKALLNFSQKISSQTMLAKNVKDSLLKPADGYELVAVAFAKNSYNDFGLTVSVISNAIDAVPLPVNGLCGSSHGQNFATAPLTDLCSVGSASTVTGSGPWSWTCYGSAGGSNQQCQAGKTTAGKVDGVCGAPHKQFLSTKPATDLCAAGSASDVVGNGPWSWSCWGVEGGANVQCEAYKLELSVNGKCGLSNGQTLAVKPTVNLCADWSLPLVYGEGPWYWFCPGNKGGTSDSCMAYKASSLAVNGVCGQAHGQTLSNAPTSNLCSLGTATGVSGNGPWTWQCLGIGGGNNASCQAQKQIVEDNQPLTLSLIGNTEINANTPGASVKLSVDSQSDYQLVYLRSDNDKVLAHRLPGELRYIGGEKFGRPWLYEWSVYGLDAGTYTVKAVAAKQANGTVMQSNSVTVKITKSAPPVTTNAKNPGKYFNKQIFVMNDLDWQKVLPMIPALAWTNSDGTVGRYPLLVYKNENGQLDLDSTIRFVQQYQPDKLTLVGQADSERNRVADYLTAAAPLGGGITVDKLNAVSADDYLAFWQSYNEVVRVENNYELALQAANYAALINAPLIIKDTVMDKSANWLGRKIICIGNVGGSCAEIYTKDSLLEKHISKIKEITGSAPNKIVFTNAKDLNYSLTKNQGFKTERTGDSLSKLFGRHSLMAPYLAAARQQILLTALDDIGNSSDNYDPYYGQLKQSNPGSNCQDTTNKFRCLYWQSKIKETVAKLNLSSTTLPPQSGIGAGRLIKHGYLTIVADPQAVPYRSYDRNLDVGVQNYALFDSADKTIFADTNNDKSADLAYGRVVGFTISDVSANIARAVFYDKMMSRDSFAMFASEANYQVEGTEFMTKACPIFKASGYEQKACLLVKDVDDYRSHIYGVSNMDEYNRIVSEQSAAWRNNDLVHYWDHGSVNFSGLDSVNIPDLSNTMIVSMSCSSAEASFNININAMPNFALMALRKGAVAYLGAVGLAVQFDNDRNFINDVYYGRQQTIGEAFRNSTGSFLAYDTLLGDPTVRLSSQIGFKGANTKLFQ